MSTLNTDEDIEFRNSYIPGAEEAPPERTISMVQLAIIIGHGKASSHTECKHAFQRTSSTPSRTYLEAFRRRKCGKVAFSCPVGRTNSDCAKTCSAHSCRILRQRYFSFRS